MSEKNSIKNKIYLILIQKRLIITDIKKELKKHYEIDISESDIRVYLKRLFDKKKIKKLERDGRYVVYTAIKKESMNDLDKFRNGFNQYHTLFKKLTKTDVTVENLKDLAKDTLDFNLLKQLEKEMVK